MPWRPVVSTVKEPLSEVPIGSYYVQSPIDSMLRIHLGQNFGVCDVYGLVPRVVQINRRTRPLERTMRYRVIELVWEP